MRGIERIGVCAPHPGECDSGNATDPAPAHEVTLNAGMSIAGALRGRAPGGADPTQALRNIPDGESVYNTKAVLTYCFTCPKGLFGGPGMEKAAQNIQDSFLNNARKDKIVLTIYLMSGVKLSGRIKSFDKYSLVLETNNQEQLIFKHAISTVVTQKTSHSYAGSPPVAAQAGAGATAPGAAAPPDGPEA